MLRSSVEMELYAWKVFNCSEEPFTHLWGEDIGCSKINLSCVTVEGESTCELIWVRFDVSVISGWISLVWEIIFIIISFILGVPRGQIDWWLVSIATLVHSSIRINDFRPVISV
jgi:hypothetical protein